MIRKKTKKNKNFYWGLKPNPILESFISSIPKGKALDLGGGEGKNSFFLAQNGFEVEIVDKNQRSLEKCRSFADEHKLPIKTVLSDIGNFNFTDDYYSLIISIVALDFLKKSEIEILIERIKKSLVDNGFVFLMVFSTEDPLYQKIIEAGLKEIEENTFYLPKFGIFRHFFTRDEIQEKFKDFKIVLFEQKQISDTGHNKPHYHNVIRLLAKKEKTAE